MLVLFFRPGATPVKPRDETKLKSQSDANYLQTQKHYLSLDLGLAHVALPLYLLIVFELAVPFD